MKDPKNLVWMDLEMTGLDPEKDVILEIATIVTDGQLNVLGEGPVMAIHQSDEVLEKMDPWCVEHHGSSGLTRRVRESTITESQAEERTLEFLRQHCLEKTSPLCGNSIHQDRRFLVRYMSRLNDYLHYRIVDVSSVKEIVERWYPHEFSPNMKKKSHLALDDIRESIEELRDYRKKYFRPSA
ncbi:MAG TPA: oligoribonuclease [Elusimicrobiota bacterium]|nr:oligoribonuclease [Elusimicrobiota bacterium]